MVTCTIERALGVGTIRVSLTIVRICYTFLYV